MSDEWKQTSFRLRDSELQRLREEAEAKGVALGTLIRERSLQEVGGAEEAESAGNDVLDRVYLAIRRHHYLQWFSPDGRKAAEEVIRAIEEELERCT